ncbi:MAG TPA: hypothetical protein VH916_08705 [Dehalococcoidia bacterium]
MTELLTVDEASERYANQWLLMRVHEYDEYETPLRGEIIAVGKHRSDIHPIEMAAIYETLPTGLGIYVFRSHHKAVRGKKQSSAPGAVVKRGGQHDRER